MSNIQADIKANLINNGYILSKDFAKLVGVSSAKISTLRSEGKIIFHKTYKSMIKKEESLTLLKKIYFLDSSGKHKNFYLENIEPLKNEPSLAFTGNDLKTSSLDPKELKIIAEKQHEERKKNPVVVVDSEEEEAIDFGNFPDELSVLLVGVKDPSKRVGIIKDFWAGKIQKQRFLREKNELIPINEAKAVMEFLFHPISKTMDNLHVDLKARFPDVPLDAIDWVSMTINGMKKSVQEYEWDI